MVSELFACNGIQADSVCCEVESPLIVVDYFIFGLFYTVFCFGFLEVDIDVFKVNTVIEFNFGFARNDR